MVIVVDDYDFYFKDNGVVINYSFKLKIKIVIIKYNLMISMSM